MGLESVTDIGRTAVVAAVRDAAAATGVDFGYLLAQARLESGLDPSARARTSSATGLYQFTSATWLDTVRRHGAAHGLGWAAEALEAGGAAARSAVLKLRSDARAAALMAGEFAADNRALLERKLGRTVDATSLYLAHFLGPAGAARFLAAHAASPSASAVEAVTPAAARANRAVFFRADGTPRSLAEVFDRFTAKIGKALPEYGSAVPELPPVAARLAPAPPAASPPASPAASVAEDTRFDPVAAQFGAPLPTPQSARLAYLLLAELDA